MNHDGDGGIKSGLVTPRRVLWAVLALVAVILLLQNSQDVTVKFLAWDVTAPLFLLIAVTLFIGWGLGELGARTLRWHRNRNND